MPTKMKSICLINILFAYTDTPTAKFKSQCFNCERHYKKLSVINNTSQNDKKTGLLTFNADNILHRLYVYVYIL